MNMTDELATQISKGRKGDVAVLQTLDLACFGMTRVDTKFDQGLG